MKKDEVDGRQGDLGLEMEDIKEYTIPLLNNLADFTHHKNCGFSKTKKKQLVTKESTNILISLVFLFNVSFQIYFASKSLIKCILMRDFKT